MTGGKFAVVVINIKAAVLARYAGQGNRKVEDPERSRREVKDKRACIFTSGL